MAEVLLVKGEDGKLQGWGEAGARTWHRFMAAVKDLAVGELIRFVYRVPRSPGFHRMHFLMLRAVFEGQEQFDDDEKFRKWCEVGAGHCDILPGPMGRMVAIPRSISYEALDDEEFRDVHDKVKDFLRSPYATRFLWSHLDDRAQMAMIATLLHGFD